MSNTSCSVSLWILRNTNFVTRIQFSRFTQRKGPVKPINQTKKLNKGGVLRKRKTSYLARLIHSCVRNTYSLPKMKMDEGALRTVSGDMLR
jgi:hypothetical protein